MPGTSASPLGRVLPRHAQQAVDVALSDTRVVLIHGARQSGKSTLAKLVGSELNADYRSLDRATIRNAATADPTEFVAGEHTLVIDEVQRVPELLLAIKDVVDTDTRPGRFLLTGLARVLGLRTLPEALPGRMETIELWPLSQGEIDGAPDGFVDAIFAHGSDLWHDSAESRSGYVERVVRGGFPEAVARTSERRRARFLDSYVADLINRDVIQLSEIERGAEMRALTRLVAARSGQLVMPAKLGSDLGLSRHTASRYLSLLEEVFLVKRIPAWSRNVSSRAVNAAKVAMVDSGIAANLLDADARRLRQDSAFGPLLEGFVLMELSRQLSWAERRVELYHYRTKDKIEVDAVLEDRQRRAVGIEVKGASTVTEGDFRGLRHLADRLGEDLLAGIVLYTGGRTLPFGPRMRAMPVSALWEAGP